MKVVLLITLMVSLVLVNGQNPRPCMRNWNNNAYDNFVQRHILQESFDRTSTAAWRTWVKDLNHWVPYDIAMNHKDTTHYSHADSDSIFKNIQLCQLSDWVLIFFWHIAALLTQRPKNRKNFPVLYCSFYRYLQSNNLCNRPQQTFMESRDLTQVKQICRGYGQRRNSYNNLCISDSRIQVYDFSVDNNCQVRNLDPGRRYVVVACDAIQNVCRPSHFQESIDKYPQRTYGRCQWWQIRQTMFDDDEFQVSGLLLAWHL